MKRIIQIILLLLVCSPAYCQLTKPFKASIPASYNVTWAKVVDWFVENGYDFQVIDKDSGIIISKPFNCKIVDKAADGEALNEYNNKDFGHLFTSQKGDAKEYFATSHLIVTLFNAGNTTTVKAILRGDDLYFRSTMRHFWEFHDAESTGVFERTFFYNIKQ